MSTSDLRSMPNIGPAIAAKLERIGIARPDDLVGRDPDDLFERLCVLDGRRHDPCLLDTFVAAVAFAEGGAPRPWWEFSRERRARAQGCREDEVAHGADEHALASGHV